MSFTFRPAKLEHGQLFIGISGPSWSGKTYSALRLATGIAAGGKIVGIDTENGRMLHYANRFSFDHTLLDPPFSPQRYGEAIKAAAALEPAVLIIDSLSHEHTGEGGVLDMHDAEQAAGKKDPAAWVLPKGARKRLIMDILRLKCHVIACMRAEDQTEWVKDAGGKLKPVPKRTLSGHVGWIPVVGKEWPYEFTVSLLVTPDALGVPKPVKLYDEHKPLVPLDRPLDEQVGRRLGGWARGGSLAEGVSGEAAREPSAPAKGDGDTPSAPSASDAADLGHKLLAALTEFAAPDQPEEKTVNLVAAKVRDGDVDWLGRNLATAEKNLAAKQAAESEGDREAPPVPRSPGGDEAVGERATPAPSESADGPEQESFFQQVAGKATKGAK